MVLDARTTFDLCIFEIEEFGMDAIHETRFGHLQEPVGPDPIPRDAAASTIQEGVSADTKSKRHRCPKKRPEQIERHEALPGEQVRPV